jgi:hypothetical protein
MKEAIVLNKADIKKIIAVYYGVEESCVLASQYSFTVIKESDKEIKPPEKVVHKSGT